MFRLKHGWLVFIDSEVLMGNKGSLFLIVLVALFSLVSCSGSGIDVVTPEGNNSELNAYAGGTTACMGLWQIAVDADSGRIDITELRTSNLIMNVLMFLEPPAFTGLSIDFDTLQLKPAQKYIGVDVILKNPLASTKFMGFDVRGVVFGPEVTNADGLTAVLSPEFFTGVPFGYQDGLLGYPAAVAGYTGLGGYKYFCEGLGIDVELSEFFSIPANVENRGMFPNGAQLTRHYDLSWMNTMPPINFMVFNYAVYANYYLPVGVPPYDIDDFDINKANSAEAFCIRVNEYENNLWFDGGAGGGHISMDVEIWDWQCNISDVSIEADGVIPLTHGVYTGPGSTDKSFIYKFDFVSGTPTQSGDLNILITATDPETFAESWYAGLLPDDNPMHDVPIYNCLIHTTTVGGAPGPCTDMEPFNTYEAFTVKAEGPPDGPWQWLLPEKAGLTASRGNSAPGYIIGAALKFYPVSYLTFGASLADSEDPIVPSVLYNSSYDLVGDIACDSQNNVYLVSANNPGTLLRSYFSGSSFTEPVVEHAFSDDIFRIAIDDEDNPIVLTKAFDYKIHHRNSTGWEMHPVNPNLLSWGIKDFDYNPVQDHYIFVCSVFAIRLVAQESSGMIAYIDNDLFGTQPMTFTPSIYIDQDDPDCHIVAWGTINSLTSYARPIARLAAIDYELPKTVSSLDPSSNGASAVGGAWVPGTNYMFIPAYDGENKEGLGRVTMPSDW